MRLEIENTLGIKQAAIELTPGSIIEVVGPNASGKTSLAVCAQAVLARKANPLGLSAVESKRFYPHNGSDGAEVILVDQDVTERWLPRNEVYVHGYADARAQPESVGLVDFTVKRGEKERVQVFMNALLPPMETVMDKVRETLAGYLPEADLVGVMQMIEEQGWEATASVYAEHARTAKRDWRTITNQTYGVKVGANWRPDGWLADYDMMTVQEAEARVTDARDALQAMHRVQAVSEAEAQRTRDAAAAMPGLRAKVEELTDSHTALLEERDKIPLGQAGRTATEAEAALDETRRELSERQSCPHCGADVAVRRGKVVAAESAEVIEERIQALTAAHADAVNAVEDMRDKAEPLTVEINRISRELQDAQTELRTAERDAKGPTEAQSQSEADRIALAQAEQFVEDAVTVVRLVRAEAQASKLYQTIARYTDIARALGPAGVRNSLLEAGLQKLNRGLKVIANESAWPLTQVSAKGAITIGDHPAALCSESERWRAQAALQLTLGVLTNSKAVVLDRGDLLDATNRRGLVRAVERVVGKSGIAVLLCSTADGNELPAPWQQIEIRDGRID